MLLLLLLFPTVLSLSISFPVLISPNPTKEFRLALVVGEAIPPPAPKFKTAISSKKGPRSKSLVNSIDFDVNGDSINSTALPGCFELKRAVGDKMATGDDKSVFK